MGGRLTRYNILASAQLKSGKTESYIFVTVGYDELPDLKEGREFDSVEEFGDYLEEPLSKLDKISYPPVLMKEHIFLNHTWLDRLCKKGATTVIVKQVYENSLEHE